MLLRKTVQDFKFCLDEIEKLAGPLSKEQRDEIAGILKALIMLLWGFKKGTHMGKFKLPGE